MEEADLGKAVEALQESVAALEKRNEDLVLKLQIMSARPAPTWGWGKFGSEPEFWENIYDSGLADCSGRCIRDHQAALAACRSTYDECSPELAKCISDAASAAALCHERCAASNPVIP